MPETLPETEYETQVTESAPGVIRSGGTMVLRGDELINDKSQIIAGDALVGDLQQNGVRDTFVQQNGVRDTLGAKRCQRHFLTPCSGFF